MPQIYFSVAEIFSPDLDSASRVNEFHQTTIINEDCKELTKVYTVEL